MPAMQDARARAAIIARLDSLKETTTPAWGRMTPALMLAHMVDALRMTYSELPVKQRNMPLLRSFPVKQLVLYVFPFPKSAPTAPELVSRVPVSFNAERETCKQLLGRFDASVVDTVRFAPHPIFGPLTPAQTGALVYKHLDHHLNQFGV
jgi:hypothetical protein